MTRTRALLLVLCFAAASSAFAKNGAFHATAHGDPVRGPQRRADLPRGSCVQCHDATQPAERGFFARNDEELCFACHANPVDGFPGNSVWSRSAHGTASTLRRRGQTDGSNRCNACHDPHGVRDSAGVIPGMLTAREPDACIECHDGSNGADIRSALLSPYRHAQDARGTHDAGEGNDPTRVAWGASRHASCSDCHNPHVASRDRGMTTAPDASPRLAGVSRIEVTNGAAGSVPLYTWRGPDDPAPAKEYEICFKCHSSWTKLPAAKPDLAVLTNPANPSSHPIQAEGRNRGIDARAFVNGFAAESLIRCSDCHTSDNPTVRGPHGSTYEFLLRKPADTGELCFDCHNSATYADPNADEMTQRASRFNAPSSAGHTFHVAVQKIPCAGCHTVHGSTRYPALIDRARPDGITTYLQTPNGGSCGATCHAMKTYTVNYPR